MWSWGRCLRVWTMCYQGLVWVRNLVAEFCTSALMFCSQEEKAFSSSVGFFWWNNWQKHFFPVKKTDSEFMGWVTWHHDILKHTMHWMPSAGCSSVVFSKELGHTVLTVQLEGQSWPMSLHRKKDRVSSKGRTSSLFPINCTDYRGLLHCDLHLNILITFKHWVLRSANYMSMRYNLRTKNPNSLCGWVSIASSIHLFCLVLTCLCCASVSLCWVSPYKPYGG